MRCFQRTPVEPAVEIAASVEISDESGGRRLLLCARCGHTVTGESSRTTMDGQHEHVRTNPHGHTFRFGCFTAAPGCASQGVPSRQHTWFAGYWWHVQACAQCGEHLGWLFFHGDHGFYGLILDRLVAGAAPGDAPN